MSASRCSASFRLIAVARLAGHEPRADDGLGATLRLRPRRERIDLGRVDAAESRDLYACAAKLALFHLSPRSGCRPMASFTIERGKRRIAPRVSYLSLLRTTRLRQKPLPDRAST